MRTLHSLLNGFRQLWAHKVRSGLTILGVVLGVAATVSVVGLIQGMYTTAMAVFQEVGAIRMIWTWRMPPPQKQAYLTGRSRGFTMTDALAIRRLCDMAAYVCPRYRMGATFSRKGRSCQDRVEGVIRDNLAVNVHEVTRGRFVCDLDVDQAAPVAVLGSEVAKRLFGPGEDALNQSIAINGYQFTVVGLLKNYYVKRGERNAVEWKNHVVLIPLSALQKRLRGESDLAGIQVQVADANYIEQVVGQVSNTLWQTHNGVQDYGIGSSEKWREEIAHVAQSYQFTLGGNVIISLLVAGVGIMNVMLASLHERIREIGLRKAMGARNWDLFVQFLGEAVILATLGGVAGILLGAWAVSLLRSASFVTGTGQPVFSVAAVTISLACSALVGIGAGLYPAVRAARLDPIEALRYE